MADNASGASVTVERKDGAVVARPLVKMLDDAALAELRRLLEESAGADSGVALVVVDLGQVAIVPSLALGLLVQVLNKCKARQQELKLVGLQPQIRQVFAMTRLDRLFQFADGVESALG